MPHGCPVNGCSEMVPNRRLMCRGHWYTVPQHLRDAVSAAYRDHGAGSAELERAQQDAIAAAQGVVGVH